MFRQKLDLDWLDTTQMHQEEANTYQQTTHVLATRTEEKHDLRERHQKMNICPPPQSETAHYTVSARPQARNSKERNQSAKTPGHAGPKP